VVIDLTPIRDGTGTSRLLDMVPGRSKAVFKAWLAARPQAWRDGLEVVAMDGFTGYADVTVMPNLEVSCLVESVAGRGTSA